MRSCKWLQRESMMPTLIYKGQAWFFDFIAPKHF